jgi:SAM-dependent methyltransferase
MLRDWTSQLASWREQGRRLFNEWKRIGQRTPIESGIRFRCNICGAISHRHESEFDREGGNCSRCGSIMRWRSLIRALSKELFDSALAISDFPRRPGLRGLGLSDEACYAIPLASRLDYTNTFYDRAPRLDITAIEEKDVGQYDFILATDVLEHVPPPAVRSFENARRLLRPGGILIFSVPYRPEGETQEHFPELWQYKVVKQDEGYVLENRTQDGREQTFSDLCFHGGPGFTLEMRVFSIDGIRACVEQAGFRNLTVYDEDDAEFGLLWKGVTWSHVMVARV